MDTVEILFEAPAATHAFGEALGRALSPGDFLGLSGELGAGKTTLVRGIAQGAGVPQGEVSSPTFAILNRYQGRALVLHHADLYRVKDRDELYATGYFDLLDDQGAMLVEWIDRIGEAAPADWLEIVLVIEDETRRRITARSHGVRSERLLKAVVEGAA